MGAILFNSESESGKTVSRLILFFLFLLGIYHWIFFFNFGNITFAGDDWPKEGKYYSILKHWVSTGEIPFHTTRFFQNTDRFFAIPETVLSPQILFLKYFDIGMFVLINTLLFYTIGFAGCLLIRARFKLSILPFIVLTLLFHFNGFITSHLGVGHSMWNGYFLLPFFCLFVLDLTADQSNQSFFSKTALKLALMMFLMVLQGSFHLYVWCVFFLALFALFQRRYSRPVIGSILFSMWLSLFRFVPALLVFGQTEYSFMTGFPTIMDLIHGYVSIRPCNYGHIPALFDTVPWWEYDSFVGLPAFIAILYFGIYIRFRKPEAILNLEFAKLDWPLSCMAVLSLSAFYSVFTLIPVPLLNAERVSSRFLIVPTVFLIIISAVRIDHLLPQIRKTIVRKFLFLVILMQTAFELATHSNIWRVENIEKLCSWHRRELSFALIARPDPLYEMSLYVGLILSAIGALVFSILFARKEVRI